MPPAVAGEPAAACAAAAAGMQPAASAAVLAGNLVGPQTAAAASCLRAEPAGLAQAPVATSRLVVVWALLQQVLQMLTAMLHSEFLT